MGHLTRERRHAVGAQVVRGSPMTLEAGEHVDVSIGGCTVRISHMVDADDRVFVDLSGAGDCDLEGEAPGVYYVTPTGATS